MRLLSSAIVILILCFTLTSSSQGYKPTIEFEKLVKSDPRLIVKSGYLIVPETRQVPNGRKIKIPFIFARRPDQDPRTHISLYTTGGPGYSTTANVDSIKYDWGFLKFGGFILFDQRGTKKAKPSLDCPEVDSAIVNSYRKGWNRDSAVLVATRKCRDKFAAKGINLSSYNTIESAEDINDLRLTLGLDSLNLVGISYSGGLMLTVARNHPEAVRTLILNSPLPGFVNYEEHALFNVNEALDRVFDNCAKDSNEVYKDLRTKFRNYFTSLNGKKFKFSFLESGKKDSLSISYTKHELLDIIVNRLNSSQVKSLPAVIIDIIEGRSNFYLVELFQDYFSGNSALSLGMRYSVYCTEQIAYADLDIQHEQDRVLPWLAGFRFNNVDHAICDCWKTKPEPALAKQSVYSSVPALLASGDIDPWCRPFYNRVIKRTMPNSQLLIKKAAGHGPGYSADGVDYLELFMANPYRKLVSQSSNMIVE